MIDNLIRDTLTNIDRSNFGLKDKVFFFRELSYLLWWWVWMRKTIVTIGQNTSNFALKEICERLNYHINNGKSLSYGLMREQEYFDEGDCAILKAWETGGNLSYVLQVLAQEYAYIMQIRNKYKSALTYPIILIVIAIAAVIALFVFVLPSIFSIADNMPGMELPLITRILQDITVWMGNYYQYALLILLIGWFGTYIFFSTEYGIRLWLRLIYQAPVLWSITQAYYLNKFCRYNKIMLSSWLSYVQTFELLPMMMQMPLFEDMIQDISQNIKAWWNISDIIQYNTELVPSNASSLILVGEETAQLKESMDNIIAIYKDELETSIANLSKLIEPIMLVFIWWIVIIIALWVFGIILQIMDSVSV